LLVEVVPGGISNHGEEPGFEGGTLVETRLPASNFEVARLENFLRIFMLVIATLAGPTEGIGVMRF
jgi:hypothetical protein